VRPPAHAGAAYPGAPGEIVEFLDGFRPDPPADLPGGRLCGVVAPHIDIRRGGAAYARAYEAIERAGGADLYVIFGTAHQGALRADLDGDDLERPRSLEEHVRDLYIFTRKSFATPLGTAETDRAFVDRLEARLGRPLDQAELSHRTEHSVEFQVLYLQRIEERLARAQGRAPRPVRIVPLLCGSLQPWTDTGLSPTEMPEVARALAAIRDAIAEEEAAGRRVLSIAGADLAHIGLKFGHEKPADEEACRACETADRASLEPVARGDPEAFFSFIAAEKDRRNICGVSCIYAMLKVVSPEVRAGRIVAYGQAPEPAAGSMVSFCSVALYG
jgi:AmmeMemoRadiSam system protein B